LSAKSKPRVLIADDEAHIRRLISKLMTSMNIKVVGEAKNGEEAVALFRKKKPHLLLLDVNMPGKTGKDALKEILDEFPDAFVIMLSSVSDRETVEDCIDIGAAHYILKDTPTAEMKKIVKNAWEAFGQDREESDA
jgi:two-component system chemotaxis response regulator CheY